MSCVEGFFEIIERYGLEDENASSLAMSQLDHELQEMGMEEQLSVFREDRTKGYQVANKHKTYIAALAEYIYNKYKVQPPEWVFGDEFILSEPTFSDDIEFVCLSTGSNVFKEIKTEDAIPEFAKRNYMISEVLCAV